MPQESNVQDIDRVLIRDYRDADWLAVCVVHDRARPDELQGSCDPRAFVPLAVEQEDTDASKSLGAWRARAGSRRGQWDDPRT